MRARRGWRALTGGLECPRFVVATAVLAPIELGSTGARKGYPGLAPQSFADDKRSSPSIGTSSRTRKTITGASLKAEVSAVLSDHDKKS
ncbi:hypothetical protein NL676_003504 [Syzygium grande]|nr:hypothetical protein NL676_003504 [Syzygium grande]